ncbi:MAG: tetratricopeptide repeat protein [Syntrophaceae bacterium]|nr:tetratricopeptide repeat protein [Syntrophaceae bacterium]
MPKCTDCLYQGKYVKQPVPFKPLGIAGASVTLVGVDIAEIQKMGFTNESDLVNYGMRCQAPGGGPTQLPIALMQAIVSQPCAHFAPKQSPQTAPQPDSGCQKSHSEQTAVPGSNESKWWQFWRKKEAKADFVEVPDPFLEGKRLSKEGKIKEAVACYSKAVVIGNREAADALRQFSEAEAAFNKGNDELRSNRFREANSLYDTALKLYPEFADAWANKAIALFQMGDNNNAIAAFEKGAAFGNKAAEQNLCQIRQQQ